MQHLWSGLASIGSFFDQTAVGAVFCGFLGAWVAWMAGVVNHMSSRAANRLIRQEKRAVLDLRHLRLGTNTIEGELVNLGLTPAQRVELRLHDKTHFLMALGVGERVPIAFARPSDKDCVAGTISYKDFAGASHEEPVALDFGSGGVVAKCPI